MNVSGTIKMLLFKYSTDPYFADAFVSKIPYSQEKLMQKA